MLNLQPGELETLDEEHRRLAHADELRQHCSAAVHQLYESDNGSVTQALGQILADLEHYRDISPALSSSLELLNGALIQAEEATTELRNFADNLEQDPAALADIEESRLWRFNYAAWSGDREIGSDGKLRGYRWGVQRKQALLDSERKANRDNTGRSAPAE